MKKSLIALAVAGVVSAPAFAATSNVDVYGVMHMSVSMFNDQDEVGGENDLQISSNASRIGFKGTEDLGGGLSAIWQIESGINLDEQNGSVANRNSYVGLKGGFGTVLLGNHDTPFKLVGRSVDMFGDTIADSRNILGGGTVAGIPLTSDMRADNVIAYMSPNFTGLNFAVAYSTDPVSAANAGADQTDMSVWSANATYTNGPLYFGVGYSDGDALETALEQDRNWRVAAGYTFGNFKIVGQYDKYDATSTALVMTDFDAWMLGGSYTMGAMVFKANYMSGEFDNCVGIGCEPEQWTVGMDYNMSKRTTVYALYASQEDGAGLGWGAGSSDWVSPEIDDVAAFSLGVKHSF